jgi:hypothetical protein
MGVHGPADFRELDQLYVSRGDIEMMQARYNVTVMYSAE